MSALATNLICKKIYAEKRIIMKIFFYALREYDEQKYVEKFAKQY